MTKETPKGENFADNATSRQFCKAKIREKTCSWDTLIKRYRKFLALACIGNADKKMRKPALAQTPHDEAGEWLHGCASYSGEEFYSLLSS
ncbi:MAG: hypothetical protein LBR88_08945 [Zoogloeaceae bacterium]|jgi:hypothetical protein|nr:hypothetical protein [Zoogloeaceae bacterium]